MQVYISSKPTTSPLRNLAAPACAADADVICMKPLDDWITALFSSQITEASERLQSHPDLFFTFSLMLPNETGVTAPGNDDYLKGPRLVSWFLVANKRSYVVHQWYLKTVEFWKILPNQ